MKLSKEDLEKMGVDIIIFDEFHHCGAPEWGAGAERLLEHNPDAQVLGLSATPIRYFDQLRDMAEEVRLKTIDVTKDVLKKLENADKK